MTEAIMPIIAASPNCFLDYDQFVAYRAFPTLGIRHVEVEAAPGGYGGIAPELMDADDLARFKARLEQFGVSPVSVGAYCDLTKDRHIGLIKHRIDFAQALGAMNVVSDATRQLEIDAEQWRKLVNTLRHLGDFAADRGVRIALETHGGLTRNGTLARRLLDAVDHPAVGVNYDTGNIYYYNDDLDPAEDIKLVADRVFQVHLKDTVGGKGEWLFCTLGQGRVNFPGVIDVLTKAGFRGPYSLELDGKRGEDLNIASQTAVIRESIEYLRRIGLAQPRVG